MEFLMFWVKKKHFYLEVLLEPMEGLEPTTC